MSNKLAGVALFLLFFITSTELQPSKKGIPSSHQPKAEFWLATNFCYLSRAFIEETAQLYRNHPARCAAIMTGVLGYTIYADEIKEWVKNNQGTAFSVGLASILTAYMTKKSWLKYLPDKDENISEDDDIDGTDPEQSLYNFSKIPVRIYRPGEIKSTLKDVAGLDAAKEDLADVVMFLKDSEQFVNIGAKIPKGILLHGSPGNGKTLLARAIAGEVNCPFLYVNASQFEEAFVGIGAARVRALFAIAKELAPCILFIDELDSVGRKRSSQTSSNSETGQTLNQLLAEIDGFEVQENPIVIIGATNRPDILDSALVRPGRFDRKVEIASPFLHDRYKILQLHLNAVKVTTGIDIYKIARGTPGYSGAELAHLVNEAAILALRQGKDEVSMLHIDQARDYINLGRETRGMQISKEEFWQTAVHEAGHAIARVLQKDAMPLHKVTITPRGGALGITFGMPTESYSTNEQELRAEIVVKLAGSVAEELIYAGRGAGASSDLRSARDLATKMVMEYGMTEEFKDVTFAEYIDAQVHLPDEIATKLHMQVTKIIHDCRQVAIDLILEHKSELMQLVDMLVEQETVFGSDVYKLCNVVEPVIEYELS